MAWNRRASLSKIFSMIFGGVSIATASSCSADKMIGVTSIDVLSSILAAMAEADNSTGLDVDMLSEIASDHGFGFSKKHESFKPAPVSLNENIYFFLGTFSRAEDQKNPYQTLKTILHTDYQGLIRYYLVGASDVIALETNRSINDHLMKDAEFIATVSQVGLVMVSLMNSTIRLLTFDAWDSMHANKKLKWMKEGWRPRWLYRKGKKVLPR